MKFDVSSRPLHGLLVVLETCVDMRDGVKMFQMIMDDEGGCDKEKRQDVYLNSTNHYSVKPIIRRGTFFSSRVMMNGEDRRSTRNSLTSSKSGVATGPVDRGTPARRLDHGCLSNSYSHRRIHRSSVSL